MTAQQAHAEAESEGLTLLASENGRSSSGYKNVACGRSHRHAGKPYRAKVKRNGKQVSFGPACSTAAEAALHFARSAAGRADAEIEADVQRRAPALEAAEAGSLAFLNLPARPEGEGRRLSVKTTRKIIRGERRSKVCAAPLAHPPCVCPLPSPLHTFARCAAGCSNARE